MTKFIRYWLQPHSIITLCTKDRLQNRRYHSCRWKNFSIPLSTLFRLIV